MLWRFFPEECQDHESFSYCLGDSWFSTNILVLHWGQKNASPGIFLSQTSVQSPREHCWFFNYHPPHRPMGHKLCLDAQGFGPSPPLHGRMNSMWYALYCTICTLLYKEYKHGTYGNWTYWRILHESKICRSQPPSFSPSLSSKTPNISKRGHKHKNWRWAEISLSCCIIFSSPYMEGPFQRKSWIADFYWFY